MKNFQSKPQITQGIRAIPGELKMFNMAINGRISNPIDLPLHLWKMASVSCAMLILLLLTLPAVAQNLITGFSDAAGEHVYYTGMNQHVYQLYWNGQEESNVDLTQWSAGSLDSTLGGPLTGFNGSDGEHLYYFGANDGNVDQLWWNGENENYQDISPIAGNYPPGGPSLGAITSFADNAGYHVYYISNSTENDGSDVYQLYWNGGSWSNVNLTTAAATGPALNAYGPMASFNDAAGEHVYYFGWQSGFSGYHVYQLYWNGQQESNHDLTAWAGAPVASAVALAAFNDAAGEHVFYIGGNHQHVYELTYNGSEVFTDLTVAASGVQKWPAQTTALTAFADTYGEHVYYIGTNQHVYQLYNNGSGSWVNQDLTALTNSTLADDVCGGKLTSFSDAAGEHVYYVGTNGHVYQLYWNGQTEASYDLTKLSNATELAAFGNYCSIQ